MEVIRWAVTVSFMLTAGMAGVLWWRNRSPATGWLGWMFASLGVALLMTRLQPDPPSGVLAAVDVAASVLIVSFPFLLFRFAESFQPVDRRWRRAVTALALLVMLATAGVLAAAAPGEDAPGWFVLAVIAVWTGSTAWVVWRLWWAGWRQSTLTRRRMWTMAAAAALLNAALVLAGVGQAEAVAAAAQLVALSSAGAFVLAFFPPRFLRALWRHADERALWKAEGDLVAADTRDAVVSAVLPHVAGLLGGGGALFVDRAGAETATGLDEASRDHVRQRLLEVDEQQGPATLSAGVATLILSQGRLGVAMSAYTPLFGKDELELMERLGGLLDLALSRVEASMTTTVLAAFERGLIPQIDPPPGLLVDTRYRAGLERLKLGGDFMDVVALPDSAAGFIIGDVSGHGPDEAAFAVGLHAGWRTLAKVDPQNPSAWIALLDETFFDQRGERIVTSLAGRIDIAQRTITLVSAGHYPPIVVGRDAHVVDVGPDPLLGIGYTDRRKERTVTLGAGQGLLLYTDGLVEQPKPQHPDRRWSDDELVAWLAGRPTVEDIDLDQLLWDFGRNSFADDVAVMLLRFTADAPVPPGAQPGGTDPLS